MIVGGDADLVLQVSPPSQNVQRFRGGLVFKAHRLCVSLNARLESSKEEEGLSPRAKPESMQHGTSVLKTSAASLRRQHLAWEVHPGHACFLKNRISFLKTSSASSRRHQYPLEVSAGHLYVCACDMIMHLHGFRVKLKTVKA